jgi:K+-sensing histidine kinase KdpD
MQLKQKSSISFPDNNNHDVRLDEYEEEMVIFRKKFDRIKEKLTRINKVSSDLETSKKEFLKIISHEVRTPLNGILGSIELMKLDLPDNTDETLFEILDESARRLEKFCYDALLFTKCSLGERIIKLNPAAIQAVLKKAILTNSQALTDKKIEVIQDAEFYTTIIADGELLTRCFSEIIENAIRNSPRNSTINVSVCKNDKFMQIEFKDYGRGFSETAINNLFKTFTRDQDFMDTNVGLGLTLVKYIITQHGGKVDIRNHEKGALVSLYLPVPVGEG